MPVDRRAQGVGLVMAGYGFGFILGPFIGGMLYDTLGFAAPFIASSSMGLIALVFAWILVPETHAQVTQNKIKVICLRAFPGQKDFFRGYLPGHLDVFSTVANLVALHSPLPFAFISPVMVFYVYDDLNFSATQFGLLVGVLGLAMVLGQIFLGGLSGT